MAKTKTGEVVLGGALAGINAVAEDVPEGTLVIEGANINESGKVETLTVKLCHKTTFPHYRRAGVTLTKEAKAYEVTPEQFEILSDDPFVVVVQATDEVEEK